MTPYIQYHIKKYNKKTLRKMCIRRTEEVRMICMETLLISTDANKWLIECYPGSTPSEVVFRKCFL